MSERVRPGTAKEVRDVVAWAAAAERPLAILGAGSKRGLGRPVAAAAELSLAGLSGIELYEPAELVMVARAGTPLAEIEARLRDNQQQLAFEPADYGAILGGAPGAATIGGVFACNLSGPRRLQAGAARDHFLGVKAVTGRGELVKSGGRVMKNVTGYDLCKLLCGSYGTLAVMTEVAFKVLPAPEETLTLLVAGLGREDGFAALRRALGSPYDVASAAWLPAAVTAASTVAPVTRAQRDLAVVRLEGTAPSVRYRAERLAPLLGGEVAEVEGAGSARLWREIRDLALLPQAAPALWRLSLAPSDGPKVVAAIEQELEAAWLADWCGGLVWLALSREEAADAGVIRRALARHGGHATLIRGSAALRGQVDVFQPQETALTALSARVKESFDPKRVLNPGRMYPEPAPEQPIRG